MIAFTIIARTLGPQLYGEYTTVIAFVNFFILFTLPGMTKPLVREGCRTPEHLRNIMEDKISIRNSLSLFAVIVCVCSVLFTNYANTIKVLIFLFSLSLIFNSLNSYFNIGYRVHEKFQYIAYLEIFKSSLFTLFAITAVIIWQKVIFLIFMNLITEFFALCLNYYYLNKIIKIKLFVKISYDRNFLVSSFIFTLTNIFWILVTRTDIIMISFLSTSEEVGIYNVSNRIIQYAMLGITIIFTILYPRIIITLNNGILNIKKYRKYIFVGLLTILLVIAGSFLYSKDLIVMLFGERYLQSSIILKILSFYLLIQTVATPITHILQALNREKKLLFATVPLPLLNIVSNYFLYRLLGLTGIAYSTLLVYTTYLVLILIMNLKILKRNIKH